MKQFNWRFAFLIGLTGAVTNTFWPIFNTYVPIILQTGHPLWESSAQSAAITGFAIGPTLAFFIMTWDNIVHMILTPWAGARSDSTWTRFGRRLPWLMVGLPIAVAGFIFIPFATSIIALIVFIMLTNIGTGIFRAPIRAWMGDFFKPADRMKAEAPVHLIGGVAAVIAALIGGRLFDAGSPAAPFILATVVVVVAALPLFIWLKEDKELVTGGEEDEASEIPSVLAMLGKMRLPENRSVFYAFVGTFLFHSGHAAYQAGVSGFGVFDINVSAGRVGQIIGLAGIVYVALSFPSGLLANRFGPRRVMMVGMLLYAANNLVAALFVNSERGLLLTLLFGGIAWALVFVNSLPLVMNTDKGRNFGVFAGLYFLAFQAASVVGPLISGALIEVTGLQRTVWYVAGAGMLLAFVTLLRVADRDFEDVGAALASD
ncbi:MAG: MFS transporter [Chloroflexota bacterium]